MKNQYLISGFLLGALIIIVGALFKITHFEIGFLTGSFLLAVGLVAQVMVGILFLVKLLSNKV